MAKANPKAKKKPATPAPRSSVAMAHSMRGGAGAGKHHTRTRDVETGRSRRPKHGGRRSLAERENSGVRLNPMTGKHYAASRQKQAARRQLEAGLAVLREAELEEARIEHARSRAKRARAPKPVYTSAYLAEKGMKRRRNTFTFLSRNPSGYISFKSIEDARNPFYRERVQATREAIDFIMDKGFASEVRTKKESAPVRSLKVVVIEFEVPPMDDSAEVIVSLMTATIGGRPLTHRMPSGRPMLR